MTLQLIGRYVVVGKGVRVGPDGVRTAMATLSHDAFVSLVGRVVDGAELCQVGTLTSSRRVIGAVFDIVQSQDIDLGGIERFLAGVCPWSAGDIDGCQGETVAQ